MSKMGRVKSHSSGGGSSSAKASTSSLLSSSSSPLSLGDGASTDVKLKQMLIELNQLVHKVQVG